MPGNSVSYNPLQRLLALELEGVGRLCRKRIIEVYVACWYRRTSAISTHWSLWYRTPFSGSSMLSNMLHDWPLG